MYPSYILKVLGVRAETEKCGVVSLRVSAALDISPRVYARSPRESFFQKLSHVRRAFVDYYYYYSIGLVAVFRSSLFCASRTPQRRLQPTNVSNRILSSSWCTLGASPIIVARRNPKRRVIVTFCLLDICLKTTYRRNNYDSLCIHTHTHITHTLFP